MTSTLHNFDGCKVPFGYTLAPYCLVWFGIRANSINLGLGYLCQMNYHSTNYLVYKELLIWNAQEVQKHYQASMK